MDKIKNIFKILYSPSEFAMIRHYLFIIQFFFNQEEPMFLKV
ncbi:MAG: hypothetical protein OP8BY_1393 [Candidatus Saccharicenans subterraneus]|uniref:Mobile element protein n=1 Tax=Candidatus Saccharicenans subterraneus TaxID=2508984 RepID=A0A3E2BPT7_9BACT|nr:MAG: hypothetical protein OP8BY_1393 [Candidatus Saccharicenans subterraneum]